MPKYIIEVRESHAVEYVVEAESPEAARERFEDGDFDDVLNDEYSHTDDIVSIREK